LCYRGRLDSVRPIATEVASMLALKLTTGLLWTIAYALIIRRSALDRAYGMPMTALCINISWEFCFTFVAPHPPPQLYINGVWLLFDVAIFAQFLRYGRSELHPALSPRLFLPILALTLVLSFGGVLAASHDFHDWDGIYSAFGSNLLMSILFIAMLLRRGDVRGQSLYIALAKLLGTMCICVVAYTEHPEWRLLYVFYAGIPVFDVAYAVLLARRSRELGIDPWRRA
jgi:hypothetical protein